MKIAKAPKRRFLSSATGSPRPFGIPTFSAPAPRWQHRGGSQRVRLQLHLIVIRVQDVWERLWHAFRF